MKKLLSVFAIGAMLVATSCSRDELPGAATTGEAAVTFGVQAPSGLATRAFGDGTTAVNLQYAVYSVAADGTTLTHIDGLDGEETFSALQTTVTLKLVNGNTYALIFWADAEDSPYTVDFDTQTMSFEAADVTGNAENRDAFFKYVEPFKVTGDMTQTVELRRPFAQLNIGTDDLEEAAAAGLEVTKTQIRVTTATEMNLVTGEVDETTETEVTYAFAAIPTTDETFPVAGYDYLSMNYLLVGAEKSLVNVVFDYDEADETKSYSFPNVPVQRNYRTNIYGSLLTSDAEWNVIIVPDWMQPDNDYDRLQLAASTGGKVVLTENVSLEQPIYVSAGVTMVLDLNGKTITPPTGADRTIQVQNGAELVINGKGTIGNLEGDALAVCVNGGKLTINDGTFYGGSECSCIYLFKTPNGSIEINGGTFKVNGPWNNFYYVLNQQNGATGTISVKGGTFENYDPAKGDDYDQPTNFVADGYTSVQISAEPAPYGTFEVVKSSVSTADEVVNALEKGVEEITLEADLTIGSVEFAATTNIDLNNHTLEIDAPSRVIASNAAVTFKNGTITNIYQLSNTQAAFSIESGGSLTFENATLNVPQACALYPRGDAAKVVIKNSTVKAATYAVATNAATVENYGVIIELENSDFNGSSPVFVNIPCTLSIKECNISGTMHGVIVRGGTATISDSEISLSYDDDDYNDMAHFFDSRNWGSGNMLNLAAMTIGNKHATSYQYPTTVTLSNTNIFTAGTYGSYFPSLYAYANSGEGLGVTLTYDDQCTFSSEPQYGSSNITVNGVAVD